MQLFGSLCILLFAHLPVRLGRVRDPLTLAECWDERGLIFYLR